MTVEELVKELIAVAYDTGYYSGKKEDGEPHHVQAIANRNALRDRLLKRIVALNMERGLMQR